MTEDDGRLFDDSGFYHGFSGAVRRARGILGICSQ
jgi:hypothetical protein